MVDSFLEAWCTQRDQDRRVSSKNIKNAWSLVEKQDASAEPRVWFVLLCPMGSLPNLDPSSRRTDSLVFVSTQMGSRASHALTHSCTAWLWTSAMSLLCRDSQSSLVGAALV